LLWLVFFFNIERLTEVVNLASFVYVYTPLVAMGVMFGSKLFRILSEIVLMLILLGIFLLLKSAFGYPIWGQHLPITITEIACIGITYLLTKKISTIVSEFENTISNLTFQQIGLPPRLYETTDTEDLYREVKRCRRFQHPLTLMIVRSDFDPRKFGSSKMLREMLTAFSTRYVQARLGKIYSEKLRDTDLVVIKRDELVVLLPETSREDSRKLLAKLKEHALKDLEIDLHCGMSFFPDNAVTLNGLIDSAASDLEQQLTGGVHGKKC
jgi:hypothetical protein